MPKIETVVFDLGGVLIDWKPEYVFRQIFETEAEMQYFFANICTYEWNIEQDAGRSLQEATDLLVKEHPTFESEIRAYYGRWEEMLGGPIQETVELLRRLKAANTHRIYALTNWSNETFPVALERYDFLQWFEGIIVSGDEKTRKPFRKIYDILLERYDINPTTAVFIDDSLTNVEGAQAVGMQGIHFESAAGLEAAFKEWNIL